jgi:hypothetical protein
MKLKEYQKKQQQLDFFNHKPKKNKDFLKKGLKFSCLSFCAFLGYHMMTHWNPSVQVQDITVTSPDSSMQFNNLPASMIANSDLPMNYDTIEIAGEIDLGQWVKSFGQVIDTKSVQQVAMDMAYLSVGAESTDTVQKSNALNEIENTLPVEKKAYEGYHKEIAFMEAQNRVNYDTRFPVYLKNLKINSTASVNSQYKEYEGTIKLEQHENHMMVERYLHIKMTKDIQTGQVMVTEFD